MDQLERSIEIEGLHQLLDLLDNARSVLVCCVAHAEKTSNKFSDINTAIDHVDFAALSINRRLQQIYP